ncbi:MAG: radical SAM/SPASM domain-containing protein [Parcubacteria group bacterium]|jgi:radical SAM protein with 4Fe4S-binding SPASM domain
MNKSALGVNSISNHGKEQASFHKIPMPLRARIEVSRLCNLKCRSCPMGMNKIKNKGIMSLDDFKKIIKLIKKSVIEIALFNYGEPLINPDIAKMVKLAKVSGIKMVSIYSNGLLLNKKLSRKLINSGLDNITISIDGASNDTYKKYRVGGDLNLILKNIKDFIAVKKDMGAKKPALEVQFVVMKHNEHEIEKFSEICKNIGVDEVVFKTFNAYMGGYEDRKINLKFIPKNINYSRYKTASAKEVSSQYALSRCAWPWENLVVSANGDICLCCHDYNSDYKLGNILKDDNWWDTEGRRKIQDNIIKGKNNINMCKHCSIPGNIG